MLSKISFSLSDSLKKYKNYLVKVSFVGMYSEIDDMDVFSEGVNVILRTSINYGDHYPIESLPQINQASIRIQKEHWVVSASGGSFNKDSAMIKAKGEFLERISTKIPVDMYIGTTPEQVEKIHTVKTKRKYLAKSYLGLRYKKVSLRDIYFALNYHRGKQTEKENYSMEKKLINQVTTNGCAGHFDYDKAVLGAWLEYIQRDAFLLYWLNTISPKKIDVDTLAKKSKNVAKVYKDLKKYNLEYYFLDITTDLGVPTCTCILVSDSPTGRRISLGAASGFSSESLIISSYMEAVSVMNFIFQQTVYSLEEKYKPFADGGIGRDERLRVYTTDAMFEKFKFFISSKETISPEDFITNYGTISVGEDDTKGQLAHLKKIFRQRYKENKDYDVFVYEIKNKLLDEFDYKVVRVMCDGLYPLYLNENYGDPNHPRLKEFVKNMGLEKVAKLNIWPHPFP